MNKKSKLVLLILVLLFIFTGFSVAQAKTSTSIHFKDKNLERALCNYYKCKAPITKEKAHKLSNQDSQISLNDSKISDLEGIQYFDNLSHITMSGNKLSNIKPLSKLKELRSFDISDNSIKGIELENMLHNLGKIDKLDNITCSNNEIKDISFLKKIGDISRYDRICMSNNKIEDISILKGVKKLQHLELDNNRITDITPIKDLRIPYLDLYLYDNCIINFIPIKSVFDLMFDGRCGGDSTTRFDFYENSTNISFRNKEIQFPYFTVYYKYQAYAEATTLINALGGNASYNKETGTLSFVFNENEYIMKDFSKVYTVNGNEKSLQYELRRMQYDLPYVPVKDICKMLGFKYNILKYRSLYTGDGEEYFDAPVAAAISKYEMTGYVNNYLYKNIDNNIEIISYLGSDERVEIPSYINGFPVTNIAEGAFDWNDSIISVILPETIQKIGSRWGTGAFSDCKQLKSVILKEGKEPAYIGANAFAFCNELTEIIIPSNYKEIGDKAFSDCTSLNSVTISEGMEYIGAGAFANDASLKSVSLPSTLKGIGYAYDNIDLDYYEYPTDTGAFENCKKLSKVTIAEGKSASYIGTKTFYKCSNLENIKVPGNYEIIYNNAFQECIKLKSFIYDKSNINNNAYQVIGDLAFDECSNLKKVTLSQTLKLINRNAFQNCVSLKEIIIPEGVEKIGGGAFRGNTSLKCVYIPSTITLIGELNEDDFGSYGSSFEGCSSLVSVIFKGGPQSAIISESSFSGCSNLGAIIIPGNYETIGEEAFSECVALKSVVYQISNNKYAKQKIMYDAFRECKNLITVSLPSTLTYLDDHVFEDCVNLETVSIPTGMKQLHINDFIFCGCSSLKSVFVGQNVKCSKYTFSLTDSKMKLYTLNKSVKKLAKDDEIRVVAPPLEYTEGKSLFGSVRIEGKPEVGNKLAADIKSVIPIDASVTYEWKIDGKVVGNETTFTIGESEKGKEVTLTVTGTNGYMGSLSKTISIK